MASPLSLINKLVWFRKANTYVHLGEQNPLAAMGVAVPHKTVVTTSSPVGAKPQAFDAVVREVEPVDFLAGPDAENERWDFIHMRADRPFSRLFELFERTLPHQTDSTVWLVEGTGPAPSAPHANAGFKLILAVHDRHPEISYCTTISGGQGTTILWRAPAHPDRRRIFSSLSAIEGLPFWNCLRQAHLLLPVCQGAVFHLLGHGLNPDLKPPLAGAETWEELFSDPTDTATMHEQKLRQYIREETQEAMEGYKSEIEALKEQLAWMRNVDRQ